MSRRYAGHTEIPANTDLDTLVPRFRRVAIGALVDADRTLRAGTDKPYQVAATVLSTPRVITLDFVTAADAGQFFHIARSSGGSLYTVRNPLGASLGTIGGGQWAVFIVSPAGAWVLSRRGLTGVGVASQVLMTTQPSASATAGVAIAQQPAVHLADVFGNPVTDSGVSITVTVSAGTLSGTTAVATVNGVATFTNLSFDDIPFTPAANRTLTFSAAGLGSVASSAVLVALGNDLSAWFATDAAGNTVDGSNHMLAMSDISGHGNDIATVSGLIAKAAALLNGKPGLAFPVGGAYMSDLLIPLKGSLTWFGVVKVVSTATYQAIFDAISTSANAWLFHDQPTNKWQVDGRLAGTAIAGSWVTIVLHFFNAGSDMQIKVRVNGVQILSQAATPTGSPVPGTVGSPTPFQFGSFRRTPAQFLFTSQITEWGYYAASKDGAEASLETYLRSKYATW